MPTLWKGEYYPEMLTSLNDHPLVGEIIVVDNDVEKTDILVLNKIKQKINHLKQKSNIFVNPAWNLGVDAARYDNICLYSDDVRFDLDVLSYIHNSLLDDSTGIIGFNEDVVFDLPHDLLDFSPPISLDPQDHMPYGFGCCMFMRKDVYTIIPSDFKIYFGDTLLFYNAINNGKINYALTGGNAKTKMGSSSKDYRDITEHEWVVAADVFAQSGIRKDQWLSS